MADEIQNQEVSSESTKNVQAEPEQAVEQQEEKLLKQSEVNKIVGGAKLDAYEKGRREALAELEKQRAAQATTQASDPIQNVNLNADQIRQMIEEEAYRRAQQQQAEQTAKQFVSKMQLGMQKHQDFEQVVTKLDIPNLPPQVIDWANAMDNTADIIYELGKNPSKLSNVLTLSVTSPRLAYDEFVRLSDSIKRNDEALKKTEGVKTAEPLDQIKSSTTGTDSGEPRSIRDLRNQSWLRG